MYTLAVANDKGGVGKTTSAVNLAAVVAERGERVLLIDLDSQGAAGRWLRVTDDNNSLLETYTAGAALRPVSAPDVPRIDVVPSSPALTEANLSENALAVLALRRALRSTTGPWSWCIIDTPPTLGVVTTSALVAADDVLVPVEASMIALPGLVAVTDAVRAVQRAEPPGPGLAGVLVCRADLRQVNARLVREALAQDPDLGDALLDTVIRDRVALRDAAGLRLPITLTDPHGDAAADYRSALNELDQRGAYAT